MLAGSHEVSGSIPLISTKPKSHSVRNGFLVCPETSGERNAAVRPIAFLRRKCAAFSAQTAENETKMQSARRRHRRRSIPPFFSTLFYHSYAFLWVIRSDPDLTQTGAKTRWIYRDLFDKTSRVSLFSRIF